MSHFYGDIQGNRGTATKGGSKASGIGAHVRGWHVGARVSVSHNEQTGEDEVTVYATSGSSGRGHDTRIASFTANTIPEAAPPKCPSCNCTMTECSGDIAIDEKDYYYCSNEMCLDEIHLPITKEAVQ